MIAAEGRTLGKIMSILVDDNYCEDGLKGNKRTGPQRNEDGTKGIEEQDGNEMKMEAQNRDL